MSDGKGENELTKEQLDKVDEILLHWADAGLCAYGRNSAGKTIVRIEDIVRMLHTLAHCAAFTGLQGLVTGRSEECRVHDTALGFIAVAKVIEYLANRCSMKEVTLCSSDPHEYLNPTWDEVAKSREYVLDDIDRVAPGWYAKAMERVSALTEAPLVKPLTDKRPEGVYDARGGYAGAVQQPAPGFAERIAAAKAGIRPKGLGEIRLDKVTRRLYAHLGEPEELLYRNYEKAAARIKTELSKKWLDELIGFIGEYETRYGERLSDNEVRYLRELVSGDITHERYTGHARIVGLEKRDGRFRIGDFGGGEA